MSIEKSFILIKPDGLLFDDAIPELILEIKKNELIIEKYSLIRLKTEIIERLYPERKENNFKRENFDYLTSGNCGVMEVFGNNAIEKILRIKGKTYQSGLRLKYANNFIHNTFHCPDSEEDYKREIKIISSKK